MINKMKLLHCQIFPLIISMTRAELSYSSIQYLTRSTVLMFCLCFVRFDTEQGQLILSKSCSPIKHSTLYRTTSFPNASFQKTFFLTRCPRVLRDLAARALIRARKPCSFTFLARKLYFSFGFNFILQVALILRASFNSENWSNIHYSIDS